MNYETKIRRLALAQQAVRRHVNAGKIYPHEVPAAVRDEARKRGVPRIMIPEGRMSLTKTTMPWVLYQIGHKFGGLIESPNGRVTRMLAESIDPPFHRSRITAVVSRLIAEGLVDSKTSLRQTYMLALNDASIAFYAPADPAWRRPTQPAKRPASVANPPSDIKDLMALLHAAIEAREGNENGQRYIERLEHQIEEQRLRIRTLEETVRENRTEAETVHTSTVSLRELLSPEDRQALDRLLEGSL